MIKILLHYINYYVVYYINYINYIKIVIILYMYKYIYIYSNVDRLFGLVVRVLGYRSVGPGSVPGTTRKKVVGLERGPLRLVSTTEELLGKKSSGSCLENREHGRRDPSR
jgi:hypothetical protein